MEQKKIYTKNRKQRRMEAKLSRKFHERKDPYQTIKGIINSMKQSKVVQQKIIDGKLDVYLGVPDSHLEGEKKD